MPGALHPPLSRALTLRDQRRSFRRSLHAQPKRLVVGRADFFVIAQRMADKFSGKMFFRDASFKGIPLQVTSFKIYISRQGICCCNSCAPMPASPFGLYPVIFSEISAARTEWVSAPTEIPSTPVEAISRTRFSVTLPDASMKARPATQSTAFSWHGSSYCPA